MLLNFNWDTSFKKNLYFTAVGACVFSANVGLFFQSITPQNIEASFTTNRDGSGYKCETNPIQEFVGVSSGDLWKGLPHDL